MSAGASYVMLRSVAARPPAHAFNLALGAALLIASALSTLTLAAWAEVDSVYRAS
jgi:hypothetical protein